MGAVTIAYVAENKLFVKEPERAPDVVESPFVQQMLDRIERGRQRNNWKSEGMTWGFGGGFRPTMAAPAEIRRVRFTGVARGSNRGEMLYCLDTDYVGGLFTFDRAEQHERRLFHRNQFRAKDLCRRGEDGLLAFSLARDDGTACIATMEQEGRGLREVTEGDVVDESPSWAPGNPKVLLFQSAGIGRNQQGVHVALSPYAIQKLDLDGEKLTTLVEMDDTDCLVPRMTEDGTLYYIGRPYEPHGASISPLHVAKDVILFPFRLVRAILYFLNFFSVLFTRKPLMTAGGPKAEGPDSRYLMLWGKVIDAEKIMKQARGESKALVPKQWTLRRRRPDGTQTVLAESVLSYDLGPDGSIVYTDGSVIFHLDSTGQRQQLHAGQLIERVSLVA